MEDDDRDVPTQTPGQPTRLCGEFDDLTRLVCDEPLYHYPRTPHRATVLWGDEDAGETT